MKIACINNNSSSLPSEIQLYYGPKRLPKEYDIKINGKFIVYAITTFDNFVWYAIDTGTYHPFWIPMGLFKIVDHKVSRFWIFTIKDIPNKQKSPFLGIPEWVNDPYFYDGLIEGNKKEVEIYNLYKKLMYLEFPDEDIKESAEIIDTDWLLCPQCIDAWQSDNTIDAMVICPKCERIYHNPRYQDLSERPGIINSDGIFG